jgi:hypothetical protein
MKLTWVVWWMRTVVSTAAEALREIFDEAAYARFLTTQGLENSREAYAKYLQETQGARERRPRCC